MSSLYSPLVPLPLLQPSQREGVWPVPAIPLRNYQREGVEKILSLYDAGIMRVVMELPTGAGKTRMALEILRQSLTKVEQGLFLVPSIDLVEQTYQAALAFFSPQLIGRVQAEHNELGRWITIACVDTLLDPHRRAALLSVYHRQRFSAIIVDEAHGAICHSVIQILEDLADPYALVVGPTATPWRMDGKSLRRVFYSLPEPAYYVDIHDLIAQRYLVLPRSYRVDTDLHLEDIELLEEQEVPDATLSLSPARKKVLSHQLMGKIRASNRYAKAYYAWRELIECKRTIIFADSLQDAYGFRDYFLQKDIPCAVITGSMPREERLLLYKKFHEGELPILINYGVLIQGVDFIRAVGAIIGRFSLMGEHPNRGIMTQMLGRILRPSDERDAQGHPVKTQAIVCFLTSSRYSHIPLVTGMNLLPGTLSDPVPLAIAPTYIPDEETDIPDEEKKEAVRETQEVFLRLKQLRVEAVDIFSGQGWQKHWNNDFSCITTEGTLLVEQQTPGLYSVSLLDTETGQCRKRISTPEHLLTATEARARAIQYTEQLRMKEQMRKGDIQSTQALLPLTQAQQDYLAKRYSLHIPRQGETRTIRFELLNQGIYYQLETALKRRDASGLRYGIYWSPERGKITTSKPFERKPPKQKQKKGTTS